MANNLTQRFTLAIVAVVMVVLCTTVQSCIRPESSSSKTKVSYKDSLVTIPGEVVKGNISNYDSLVKVLQELRTQGKPAEIIYRNTPESKTFLTLKMDDQGRVQAECETNEQILKLLNKIIETENTHIVHKIPKWAWIGMAVLLSIFLMMFGLIVLIIFLKLLK